MSSTNNIYSIIFRLPVNGIRTSIIRNWCCPIRFDSHEMSTRNRYFRNGQLESFCIGSLSLTWRDYIIRNYNFIQSKIKVIIKINPNSHMLISISSCYSNIICFPDYKICRQISKVTISTLTSRWINDISYLKKLKTIIITTTIRNRWTVYVWNNTKTWVIHRIRIAF